MGSFVPDTKTRQEEMLHEIGYASWDALFADIPESVRLRPGSLDLPEGLSELAVSRELKRLAGENVRFEHVFRGAGAYRHYIPAIVGRVTRKESFLTAYTPYQAEISQGILQSIFEFQTMICQLTGMDAANASVYDGATAAAEAAAMCVERKRTTVYVSETIHPDVMRVVSTYCFGRDTELKTIPAKNGVTDTEALKAALDEEAACVLIASPNFNGLLEPSKEIGELAHAAGAKFVMSCDPIALALFETPAECGADIAVGEGQSLGLPLSWGGPYLGYMAATSAMMRKLPGRIVGETKDKDGSRAFVLTLQAREQHIRREKAGSNICSNEALCALAASVYLAAMGPGGLREVASQSYAKAHYLQRELAKIGLSPVYEGEFFEEFLTDCPHPADILEALEKRGYLGGLPLSGNRLLWCATEMNTKDEIDELVSLVKEAL